MNLPLLLRPPLLWLVIAETLVVTALGVATWRALAHQAPGGAVAAAPARPAPAARPGTRLRPAPAPSAPPLAARTPQPGPTPALRTDSEFLARQLDELNQVESSFENLEWRVTSAVVDAIRAYVDRVVVPSIDRTEKASR